MREQTEGIGIAFKVSNIVPELMADLPLQVAARSFGEVGLNGFLTTMAEGRITHIVCQTSRGHNLSDLGE